MYINEVLVSNFRLLENEKSKVFLDEVVTIIVGKNNTGKTSFMEIFSRFFASERARFKFEDFSLSTHQNFNDALELYKEYLSCIEEGGDPEEIESKRVAFVEKIPYIQLRIIIRYSKEDIISTLIPFILNLDAIISLENSVNNPETMFQDFLDNKTFSTIIEFLAMHHSRYFQERAYAVDSRDHETKVEVTKDEVRKVIKSNFIYAQRDLDDQAESKTHRLSSLFGSYFESLTKIDDSLTQTLDDAISTTSGNWDSQYEIVFKEVLADIKKFGYPGLSENEIIIKSVFAIEKILKDNTHVHYKKQDYNLPEAYNGLGYSNLIYIILQIMDFCKKFEEDNSAIQLLFLEEPEAHMHPQMQYTFIRNITKYIKSKGWPIQVTITTHSAHIIAKCDFKAIRYFETSNNFVTVKDMRLYSQEKKDTEAFKFLEQYMLLSYCELFFADKVIMVEGTTERLLLPYMTKKVDEEESKNLSSEYISVIEVGGAYAHKFKELLNFINVKTLIITDIDTIEGSSKKKCPVCDPKCKYLDTCEQVLTSNPTLTKWIPGKNNVKDLLVWFLATLYG